ncbi:hypothetical protein GS501_06865 [Saccharibacter sp. 17.LH.SD]|uniref:NUDIX hydrolase n=1 Tax=Saccharibacter sp. 17.LH.SD TaxID=2689393 RepID=UPI00136A6970|nr:hypothetical protein [Saccharibacter sp. 17.LH.SD]MXV44756.1 hypothetical protein [Saccharibacter sp. 17.LH.SD]
MTQKQLCEIDLLTVVITLGPLAPHILTVNQGQELPSGPLTISHRSLQKGLHQWAERHTGCAIGHMEQLYTFTDHTQKASQRQLIRISYLALARVLDPALHDAHSLYDYFPWEDRRSSHNASLLERFRHEITLWARSNSERMGRVASAFGLHDLPWDDEKVLDRYELLWEAGLVSRASSDTVTATTLYDNRRILATALSRLRAKIRYTPIVFDLLPEAFTLLQLQQAMENLSGRPMHKPNFRRLVLHQNLVEETGARDATAPGRPAKLYRFRPSAATSCYLSGAMLPLS